MWNPDQYVDVYYEPGVSSIFTNGPARLPFELRTMFGPGLAWEGTKDKGLMAQILDPFNGQAAISAFGVFENTFSFTVDDFEFWGMRE